MKISTKGRYGLKAVMEIARQADNGHVSMRDLSQTTGISASYLEQLFKKLRAAGVLRSVRGAPGGLCAGKVYTRNYGRRSAPGFGRLDGTHRMCTKGICGMRRP